MGPPCRRRRTFTILLESTLSFLGKSLHLLPLCVVDRPLDRVNDFVTGGWFVAPAAARGYRM